MTIQIYSGEMIQTITSATCRAGASTEHTRTSTGKSVLEYNVFMYSCLLFWTRLVPEKFHPCPGHLTTRVCFGIRATYKCTRNHTYWGLKNNWSIQSKNGLQNLWGNIVFLILFKELDVVPKIISFYNPIKFLAILYPTSQVNLVVEVGTRHSHQILLQLRSKSC